MKTFSELFVPDFEQSKRYYNELLSQAVRERFTRQAGGSLVPRSFSFGTRLRLLLTNLRDRKTTTSRTSTLPS